MSRNKKLIIRNSILAAFVILAAACTFGGTVNSQENTFTHAQNLWNARTQYVGNNSAVGKLLGLLSVPDGAKYSHFELQTGERPYGIKIVYDVSAEVLKKYDAADSRIIDPFQKNALLLLALVGNADQITAVFTDGSGEMSFINDREWADEIVGCDVRDYAESPEKLQELIDFSGTEAVSHQYSIAKIRRNGGAVAVYSLQNESLAEEIIMDYMLKSAAWEGIDINTLEECYLISQTISGSGETFDFYAYLLKDGTPVLQSGKKGRYTVISRELYSRLGESFKRKSGV
ncbi:DUF4825 domain-containing protein [Lachnospiraceae bacterium 54-53]